MIFEKDSYQNASFISRSRGGSAKKRDILRKSSNVSVAGYLKRIRIQNASFLSRSGGGSAKKRDILRKSLEFRQFCVDTGD